MPIPDARAALAASIRRIERPAGRLRQFQHLAVELPPASASTSAADDVAYPVTVSNCGTPVTYSQAPTRAVSNDINTTEDMLALGLESHMVGEFAASGSLPAGQPLPGRVRGRLQEGPRDLPRLFHPREARRRQARFPLRRLELRPPGRDQPDPANLAKYGIKTLALTESCAHVQAAKQTVSIDDTYQDLTNLGKIFGVAPNARQVINGMKAQIAAAQAKVASSPACHRVRL